MIERDRIIRFIFVGILPLLGLLWLASQGVQTFKQDKINRVTPGSGIIIPLPLRLFGDTDITNQLIVSDEDFFLLHARSERVANDLAQGKVEKTSGDLEDGIDPNDLDVVINETKSAFGAIEAGRVDSIKLDARAGDTASMVIKIKQGVGGSEENVIYTLTWGRNEDTTWRLENISSSLLE